MHALRHIHLPNLTNYKAAQGIQETLARGLLNHKAAKPPSTISSAPSALPPPSTILTAEFFPVYTLGRREKLSAKGADYEEFLRKGGEAEVYEALRGGQTTFHGPGQLVAYPVLDLLTQRLSARCYVNLLEECIIATCVRYGIKAYRTEHTGIWTSADRKIGAVGVHLRRNVSSHGIALNVETDLRWFDRIVACGLADKKATSFVQEGVEGKSVAEVGEAFVHEMATRLKGVEGITKVSTLQDLGTNAIWQDG